VIAPERAFASSASWTCCSPTLQCTHRRDPDVESQGRRFDPCTAHHAPPAG
jgi:hypothetical protein